MSVAQVSEEANFVGYDCEINGVLYRGVLSPLSRALEQGLNVMGLLETAPESVDSLLTDLVASARAEIGSDPSPFNYIIAGAEPEFTTPMQYGGHFLELDRELVANAKPAITLIGGSETYVDVVSDLARSFLILNPETNPACPDEIAKMTSAIVVTQVSAFPTLTNGGGQ